jgi:hypothetical protein
VALATLAALALAVLVALAINSFPAPENSKMKISLRRDSYFTNDSGLCNMGLRGDLPRKERLPPSGVSHGEADKSRAIFRIFSWSCTRI